MKRVGSLLVMLACTALQAQDRIYVCGTRPNVTYTNSLSAAEARSRGCKTLDGASITVIEGSRPAARSATTPASPAATASRIDGAEQRARDADARAILEAELKKTQARHADLLKEYNNGEPEKRGDEVRNHQRYLDRVAELKAAISRGESDMAGIRRELSRLPAGK